MGMIELTAKLFMEQAKKHDFSHKHLVTIGKQGITFSVAELRGWALQCGFCLNEGPLLLAEKTNSPLSDIDFFKSIGFESVDSLDCSEYEGASIICNLNNTLPSELLNRFDIVYDGGSTEHMFNVPQAFENYNKMLRVGGLIIHSLPSTGCLDHGFYMFSPTLFYDYYIQNHWRILDFFMIQLPHDNFDSWALYEYGEPGPSLEDINFNGRWTIFFIARKMTESTFDYNIEQHFFKKLWQSSSVERTETSPDQPSVNSLRSLRKIYRMLPVTLRIKIRSLIFKTVAPVKPSDSSIPFKKISLLPK